MCGIIYSAPGHTTGARRSCYTQNEDQGVGENQNDLAAETTVQSDLRPKSAQRVHTLQPY